MKRRSIIILGAVAAVAAVLSVPFLLPLDIYRAPIERATTAAIGREVRIAGPLHLSIYPQIGISLSKVSIANAPGARNPQMIEVDSVLVGVIALRPTADGGGCTSSCIFISPAAER